LRNESVHKEFIGEGGDDHDVLGDADDASRLCDIFNRAILCYANYSGPVLSAKSGQWIDARSSETYRVPPIPNAGTIEIRQNVSPPPLTENERVAFELLGKMQRAPAEPKRYVVDHSIEFPRDDPW